MNIQEYISSGILESYALGDVTPAERASVEEALRNHPALREELQRVEVTLEKIIFSSAVKPSPGVKEKLMARVGKPEGKTLPFMTERPFWKYATAASLTIALISSYLAFYYNQRWKADANELAQLRSDNQRIAEEYNTVNQKLDKIQGDLAIMENDAFTKVVMKAAGSDSLGLASVYWNSSTKEVYLSVQELKAISKEKQFQLWAIVNGKPVDAGVFDLDFAGLLKMKSIAGATAFAVTIEPRGGKAAPTLETMQVVGTVTDPS